MTTKTTRQIDPKTVVNTYHGRPGCACGCRGTYAPAGSVATRRVNKVNAGLRAGTVEILGGLSGETIYELLNENGSATRVYTKEM